MKNIREAVILSVFPCCGFSVENKRFPVTKTINKMRIFVYMRNKKNTQRRSKQNKKRVIYSTDYYSVFCWTFSKRISIFFPATFWNIFFVTFFYTFNFILIPPSQLFIQKLLYIVMWWKRIDSSENWLKRWKTTTYIFHAQLIKSGNLIKG